MTREEVKNKILEELRVNGIQYNEIAKDSLIVKYKKGEFFISFLSMSYSVSVYYYEKDFEPIRLMSLDFFYDDTDMIWVSSNRLFVRPATRSYCVFVMGEI